MAPVTLLVALTLGILLGPITGQAQQAPESDAGRRTLHGRLSADHGQMRSRVGHEISEGQGRRRTPHR